MSGRPEPAQSPFAAVQSVARLDSVSAVREAYLLPWIVPALLVVMAAVPDIPARIMAWLTAGVARMTMLAEVALMQAAPHLGTLADRPAHARIFGTHRRGLQPDSDPFQSADVVLPRLPAPLRVGEAAGPVSGRLGRPQRAACIAAPRSLRLGGCGTGLACSLGAATRRRRSRAFPDVVRSVHPPTMSHSIRSRRP